MATWTVHAGPGDLDAAVAADRLVVLREGFSWPALIVPFLWAPWHRLWWVGLGWLAATVAILAVDRLVDPTVGTILSLAFTLWFALVATDLRRWTLERCGWRLVGLVEARGLEEAEQRFFARLADPTRPRGSEFAGPAVPSAAATPTSASRDLPPVVGFAGLPGGRS